MPAMNQTNRALLDFIAHSPTAYHAADNLARRLAGMTGRTVILTVYNNDWSAGGLVCRVVDTDEIWALVLADEGKKREREMLIRLDDVKSVKEA